MLAVALMIRFQSRDGGTRILRHTGMCRSNGIAFSEKIPKHWQASHLEFGGTFSFLHSGICVGLYKELNWKLPASKSQEQEQRGTRSPINNSPQIEFKLGAHWGAPEWLNSSEMMVCIGPIFYKNIPKHGSTFHKLWQMDLYFEKIPKNGYLFLPKNPYKWVMVSRPPSDFAQNQTYVRADDKKKENVCTSSIGSLSNTVSILNGT